MLSGSKKLSRIVSPSLACRSSAAQEFRAISFGPSGGKRLSVRREERSQRRPSAKSMAVTVEYGISRPLQASVLARYVSAG